MLSSNTSAANGAANYIEDMFSTYLYTGNGSTQTITNNIDLSTKGGLVWIKDRDGAGYASHYLADTITGRDWKLSSDSTSAKYNIPAGYDLTSFNSNGFSVGSPYVTGVNNSGDRIASWTFRKQPKFFDVVTYTGNGTAGKTVAHSLGSTPGCIIVKRTDTTADWIVYHRGNSALGVPAATVYERLNTTASFGIATVMWNDTAPTDTNFTLGTFAGVNANGGTYVAYIFAHDAGGFGLTGTDNVISCGSFTTGAGNGNATVDVGYEPQFLLTKASDGANAWRVWDTMRGFNVTNNATLYPFASYAEDTSSLGQPTSTGFKITGAEYGKTFIYIAIRKGPMKVPTDATKVFKPNTVSSDASAQTTNFPVDMFLTNKRAGDALNTIAVSKLTSNSGLVTSSTAAEAANYASATWWQSNTSYTAGVWGTASIVDYAFQRAPSFFDEVCDTGTSATHTINHNLGVKPELIIRKARSTSGQDWWVYSADLTATQYLILQTNGPAGTASVLWNDTEPTPSVFTVGNYSGLNNSGITYVTYLFATCPGVSKVGSYTGTGTTKQIDCGFAAGARFVLIKRTDSTGDWYVWDTARGIVSGNDPYLLLNSTAAEVTSTDYIDPYSAGFELSSTAPAALNASGGSYIFLAIA